MRGLVDLEVVPVILESSLEVVLDRLGGNEREVVLGDVAIEGPGSHLEENDFSHGTEKVLLPARAHAFDRRRSLRLRSESVAHEAQSGDERRRTLAQLCEKTGVGEWDWPGIAGPILFRGEWPSEKRRRQDEPNALPASRSRPR